MEVFLGVKLQPEQAQKLEAIAQMTGWSKSEVIRRLIDGARVTPPAITTTRLAPKGQPLAAELAMG